MGFFRVFLALCVVVQHAGGIHNHNLLNGTDAVRVFFMISGFYMAMILTEKYVGLRAYRLFITNRLLKIYPTYWAATFCSLLICLLMWRTQNSGPIAEAVHAPHGITALTGLLNVVLIGKEAEYFFAFNPHGFLVFCTDWQNQRNQLLQLSLNPPAWTLSLELTFYFIAPFLVHTSVRILVALLALSLAFYLVLVVWMHLPEDPWAVREFPASLCFFLAGLLSYRFYRMLDRRPSVFTPWQLPMVSVFSLLLLIFPLIPVRGFRGVTVNEWTLYSLAWVAIPVLFMTSRRSRVDRYVGEFSYGIYVIHYPVIWLVRLYTTHAICLYVLALSIGLALVINHFVATPIERIRQKRSAKARQRSPMLVGAAG